MKKAVQATLIALGILPFSLFGDTPLVDSRAIVQLMQGSGDNTGGQLDLLMPFYGNENQFLYTDLQAYKYGELYQTLSASLGARAFMDNAVYGAYAFYDFQTSPNNFNYNRVNLGVERLGEAWEWRANIYSYLNEKNRLKDLGQVSAFVQGNNIQYNHQYEVEQAYILGGDLEMGRTLGLESLRGYLAYYNYGNEIVGGRARVSYELNSHWQVFATSQYDAARGWLTYGAINYWIGKAKTTTGTALDKLRDPIIRDMTVAVKIVDNYNTIDTDSRHIYFANPNDTASLETILKNSKEGDFIYLENGTYDLNNAINLQTNQTLWGTGANLYANNLLLIPASGTTTLNANNLASLTPNCGLYVCAVYANNSSNYGGFDITNSASYNNTPWFVGFFISNNSTVNLDNINVSGFLSGRNNGTGFVINNGNSNTVNLNFNNITANNNNMGLVMYSGNATIAGAANTFNSNSVYGIYMSGGTIQNAQNVEASGNSYGIIVMPTAKLAGEYFNLNNNTTYSLQSGGNVYLTNSSFSNANHNLIEATAGSLTIINPVTLVGIITENSNNLIKIQSNNGTDYIPALAPGHPVTCNTVNRVITCQ